MFEEDKENRQPEDTLREEHTNTPVPYEGQAQTQDFAGQAAYSQASPQQGTQNAGPSGYAQNAYNQNGYAQNSYAQNGYGQNAYGQNAGPQAGWQGGSAQPPQGEAPKKKHGGKTAKHAAIVAASALAFGAIAGGTMWGVNYAADTVQNKYAKVEPVQIHTAEAQENTDGDSSQTASSSGALPMDVSGIVEEAMPSVVAINNTTIVEQQVWFGITQQYEAKSSGSGIIVGQNDEELLIVTNNHVVEDSKDMMVTFIDDAQVSATVKGTDSDTDLAVISVPLKDIPSETMSKIKVATMGDSDSLKVGQGVIAIGNALGYGQSVTVGYVSALDREVQTDDQTTRNLLQTDAAINPGNSGGALLNMKGEVIGINSAKYSSTEVEGMGYAIPISKVQDIINELMNRQKRTLVEEADQGYLGIQGNNIDDSAATMYGMPRGIYVYKIMDDSAAADSDLHEKDIITKFDGQTVRTMAELKELLTYYKAGTTVDLTVQSLQDGEYVERTVTITLGKRDQTQSN